MVVPLQETVTFNVIALWLGHESTSTLRALVVAPVVGSVVLMFVTAGFAVMAIGAFSNFIGYRIRRQDGGWKAR